MSNLWGDITDEEFVELKKRFGDFVLEEPSWAVRLVEDLRREKTLAEMKDAAR
jgi:hypothetical protein